MMVAGACADTTWDTHTLSVCAPYAAEVGWEMGLGDLEMVDGDEADHGEVVVPETDRQTKNDVSLAPPSREELTRGARRRTALAWEARWARKEEETRAYWMVLGTSWKLSCSAEVANWATTSAWRRDGSFDRAPTTPSRARTTTSAAAAASVSAPPPLRRTSYANSGREEPAATASTASAARAQWSRECRMCWPTLAPTRGQTDV
mmetsp:Transcript_3143/g.10390  ORF Transcript_3143/g.10390 Transcript_3143/m.10390 type:complete len:205 (+) Transcript_3143:339-953(+)